MSLKIILVGIALSLINWGFDCLSKQKRERMITILGLALLISVFILLSLFLEIWLSLVFSLVALMVWGLSAGSYEFGIDKGKKYWRNHVEKFYAYGIGFLIIFGLSFFWIVGMSLGGKSPEEEYYENYDNLTLYDFFNIAYAITSVTLPSYWLGVFIQNLRENKKNNTETRT